MSGKSLSNLSKEATEVQNAAGVLTPILEIEPEDGTMISLLNDVDTGNGEGLPIFADLRDDNGNQISTNTGMVLRAVRPTDDSPVPVSVKDDNIAPYNQLSVKEQRNEENIDSVKIELRGDRINIRDRDVLRVELESPEVVDWSNSELFFYRQGVEQMSFSR